jgi:hypothetical protein
VKYIANSNSRTKVSGFAPVRIVNIVPFVAAAEAKRALHPHRPQKLHPRQFHCTIIIPNSPPERPSRDLFLAYYDTTPQIAEQHLLATECVNRFIFPASPLMKPPQLMPPITVIHENQSCRMIEDGHNVSQYNVSTGRYPKPAANDDCLDPRNPRSFDSHCRQNNSTRSVEGWN